MVTKNFRSPAIRQDTVALRGLNPRAPFVEASEASEAAETVVGNLDIAWGGRLVTLRSRDLRPTALRSS